jgi:hypothetical protein
VGDSGSAGAGAGRARAEPDVIHFQHARRCVRLQARRLLPAAAPARRRLSRSSRNDGPRVRLVGVGAARRPVGEPSRRSRLGGSAAAIGTGRTAFCSPGSDVLLTTNTHARGLHSPSGYRGSPPGCTVSRSSRTWIPSPVGRDEARTEVAPGAAGLPTRRSSPTSGSSTRSRA